MFSITASSLERAELAGIDLTILEMKEEDLGTGQFQIMLDFLFIALCNHYPELTRGELGKVLKITDLPELENIFKDVSAHFVGEEVERPIEVEVIPPEEDVEIGPGEPVSPSQD
jgi:hypothetical protein